MDGETDLTKLANLHQQLSLGLPGRPLMSELEALQSAIDEIAALRIKVRAVSSSGRGER